MLIQGALMKRFISTKSLAAAGLVLGALGVASAAHARSDVYFSVGVHAPGVYAHPAPVYVQPAPVYVQPRPVYVEPRPVYVPPAPVYVQPRPAYVPPEPVYEAAPSYYGGYGGYGHERRWARRYGPYGDLDRDGIMNMDDRDRDGDGIRNRHDRFPMDPYRY